MRNFRGDIHAKDKQLTPKLVTAIISAGIMTFAGVVAETAMNIPFRR